MFAEISPAHTDFDVSVHFTEADIFHAGDTLWNRPDPFIDYAAGGSIDGTIGAAEANVAKVTSEMMGIPGHGTLGHQADLLLSCDVLAEMRDKISALKKPGQSLAEVIAAKSAARTDDEWASPSSGVPTLLLWCTGASEKSVLGHMRQEIC
jgi:glyoxylase-like metal-dependent hydrolase (beta-lactamase superfamily II)